MTSLIIRESKLFKKGSYRFWGCMPIYDNAAAKAVGKSDEWIKCRSAEVHREAMRLIVQEIRQFCKPRPWLFADGVTRLGEGRPAIFIGDQPGQDKLLSKLTKGCSVCMAPFEELDCTDKDWPLRDSLELLQSMRRVAAECLNDAGEVIRGKKKILEEWESANRMRFGSNAVLEMIDLGFHALLQLPRCFLHLVVIGLFGHHVCKASIHLIEITIIKKEYTTAHGTKGRPGYRKPPLPENATKGVLQRLADRLSSIISDESCLTITADFSRHFLKVYEKGRSSFTGDRMMYIMLTLPYVIRDIAGPERQRINTAIQSAADGDPLRGAQLVEDPCEKIVECLLDFLHWFLLIRRRELLTTDIAECIARGQTMMESLKDTFPEKGGELSGWKFGKFHSVKHLPLWIILFGWVEIFSGMTGERGHRELLKSLAGCVNNKDVFGQYLTFWERAEQLARARREHAQHDSESTDSESDTDLDAVGSQNDAGAQESMHACELGVRCPLFFMALHRSALHHRPASRRFQGNRDGRQRFNVWLLRDAKSKAVQELPILQTLPRDLAVFAYMFCRRHLGLPRLADRNGKPEVDELNNVLLRYLHADRSGRHLRTFGILELESERCLGVQRVRCFPFSWDKHFKRNWAQYVGIVPPETHSGIAVRDFTLSNAEHRKQMWVGRVELLFTAAFIDSQGSPVEYDLAFLSCLYDFEHPSATGPMQLKAGARMFYAPSIAWTVVLPIRHILGRVPLMRLYLAGSAQPTIPHSLAGDKRPYFEHGCADRAGRSGIGSGSRLFELNVHLWQYGRPQPRTMSVQERLDRKEARLRVSHEKRKETMARNKRSRQDAEVIRPLPPSKPPPPPFSHSTHN